MTVRGEKVFRAVNVERTIPRSGMPVRGRVEGRSTITVYDPVAKIECDPHAVVRLASDVSGEENISPPGRVVRF